MTFDEWLKEFFGDLSDMPEHNKWAYEQAYNQGYFQGREDLRQVENLKLKKIIKARRKDH